MGDKSKVEGAGALSELFKLLFKGIDKVLDSAAEYENDMGVLKQVNKIPVTGPDGKDYEVIVKLAPVKDRQGLFYVEISSNYPEFDGSELDKQVIKANRDNWDDFNAEINKVLRQNKLQLAKTSEASDEPNVSNATDIDCYDQYDYEDWLDNAGEQPEIITVTVSEYAGDKKGKVNLQFRVSDNRQLRYDGQPVEDIEDLTQNVDANSIDDNISTILKANKLVPVDDAETPESANEGNVLESKHIDVSLSYIKSNDEINLSAIYANYDIQDAMNSLQLAVDSDAFINMLSDEPQCFRITDEGEDLDIQPIEEVDISNVNCEVNNAIGNLAALLDAYYVNMDPQQQAASDELTDVLQRARNSFQTPNLMDEL